MNTEKKVTTKDFSRIGRTAIESLYEGSWIIAAADSSGRYEIMWTFEGVTERGEIIPQIEIEQRVHDYIISIPDITVLTESELATLRGFKCSDLMEGVDTMVSREEYEKWRDECEALNARWKFAIGYEGWRGECDADEARWKFAIGKDEE